MIQENPFTTRRLQARAIGWDQGSAEKASWPAANGQAASQVEDMAASQRKQRSTATPLANGAPSRQGRSRTLPLELNERLLAGAGCSAVNDRNWRVADDRIWPERNVCFRECGSKRSYKLLPLRVRLSTLHWPIATNEFS
jgi:hypothetical protein